MEKNNIISDWLDQYGNPKIDKFVETKLNQNNMKQTAVEWFFKWFNDNPEATHKEYAEAFEQAKEMERQQIMTAFIQGDIFGEDYYDGVNITEENYYNQTFKSE